MRKATVILVLLVVVGGGAWWFVFRPGAPLSPNREADTPAIENKQMPPEEVQRFESALNSPDRNQQASVMSPDLQAAYLAQGQSMLPMGSIVRLQPDTFAASDNAAHVGASFTAPDGMSTTYNLVLIRTDADSPWLLANTEGK